MSKRLINKTIKGHFEFVGATVIGKVQLKKLLTKFTKDVEKEFIKKLHIKKLESYKKVLEHRRNCREWRMGENCLECFGGGLSNFLNNVKREIK